MPGGVSYLGDFLPPPAPELSELEIEAAARVASKDTGLEVDRPCETGGR